MDRRRNARVAAFIPVRLWGMDANSLPFTQMATVKNISSSGVEIHGLMRQGLPGELLDVQLGEDRAQYRVVWAGRMGSRKEGRSEEHTSELQSRLHLVCRLLLEKKNKNVPGSFAQARQPCQSPPLP